MKKMLTLLLALLLMLSASALAEEPAAREATEAPAEIATCQAQFGDESDVYTVHFYDNDTAVALYRAIPESGLNLPIYTFDGYEGWEVMTFYDIPSRFDIPSEPVRYETQQSGQLYYSVPNRLMLFYGDAEMPGDYVLVGYIEDSEAFRDDVANNQPLEYWGNKLIMVSRDGE